MKHEAENGVENVIDARWRTAQAVGSEHTISNILKAEGQQANSTETVNVHGTYNFLVAV